jgi:hypothetical protein
MDRLRTPYFVIAVICLGLAVLFELGSMALVHGVIPSGAAFDAAMQRAIPVGLSPADFEHARQLQVQHGKPPGVGIPMMALVDAPLLMTLLLLGSSLVVGERVQGKIQGIANLVLSIVVIVIGLIALLLTFFLLMLMVSLFFAVPFGTLTYLALWGSFDTAGAGVILTATMMLKLAAVVCLVIAQQRFVTQKGLGCLILMSLLANVILSFLHALVPSPLVSITDALGAIALAIIAIILAVVRLVFSIVALVRIIQINRSFA